MGTPNRLFPDFEDEELSLLIDFIPQDELIARLSDPCNELDPTFLGFPYAYLAVSQNLAHTFDIVDIGSYTAAQSYVFSDFRSYTAVDVFDTPCHGVYSDDFTYEPPLRFSGAANTNHVIQDGLEWLQAHKHDDNTSRYIICSAVPAPSIKDYLLSDEGVRSYPNLCYWYPGDSLIIRGSAHAHVTSDFINLYTSKRDHLAKG